MEGNEGKAPRPLTSRTSATPAPDSKSDRVRLPTPSELDDWPGLDEALEELLAEKRAKEAAKKGTYPTAMALVIARAMKRVAVKYADLGLARRAKYLENEALSALKNGQSALSNPREINSRRRGLSTTPAPDAESDYPVGSPRLQFASATLPSVLDPSGSRTTSTSRIGPSFVNCALIRSNSSSSVAPSAGPLLSSPAIFTADSCA